MRLSGSGVYQRMAVPKMPPGLVELLEGLTRDVLKHNPPDVYEFCANHMQKLLEIRDGPSRMKTIPLNQKIKSAQEVVRKRAEQSWLNKDDTKLLNSNNNIHQKLLNPVHHDNDLTNCSEIEISFQPGGIGNDEKIDHSKNADRKEEVDVKKQEPLGDLNTSVVVKLEDIHSDHIENTNDKDTDLSNNVNIEENLRNKEVKNPQKIEKSDMAESIYCVDQSQNFNNIEPKMESLVVQNVVENDETKTNDLDADIATKTEEMVDNKTTQNSNDVKDNDMTDQSSQKSVQKTIDVSDAIHNVINLSDNKNSTEAENYNNGLNTIEIYNPSTKDGDDGLNITQQKQDMITNSNIFLTVPNITIGEQNQNHAIKTDVQDNRIVKNNILEVQNKDTSTTTKANKNNDMNPLSLKQKEEVCPGSNKAVEIILSSITTDTEKQSPDQENKPTTVPFKEDSADLNSSQKNKEDNLKNTEKDKEHKNGGNIVEHTVKSSEVIENFKVNQKSNVYLHSDSDILQRNDDSAETITVNRELTDISNEGAEECEKKISENIAIQESKAQDDNSSTEIQQTTKAYLEETIPSKRDSKQLTDSKTLDNFQENNIQRTDNVKSNDCETEESSSVEAAVESGETECFDDNLTNDSVNNMDLETAAVTIQKVFRTFLFKSRASTFDDSINEDNNLSDDDNDQDNKETRSFLTSTNKDRRALGISRMDTVLQTVNEEKSLSLSTDDSSTLSSAATIIQAHVRGFLVRNKLNSGKTASSTNSLINSDGPSTASLDGDGDQHKNKTILNIHIVPEGNNFLSRDESMITSMDLSLDGSPPSVNLHPLGYDKSERRKQLKREDAIQSVSPPSNNSGKLSEDVESVKELPSNSGSLANASLEQDTAAAIIIQKSNINSNDDTLNALANASLEQDTAAAILSKEFIKQESNINSNDDTLNAFANASLEQDTAAAILSKEFIKQESNINSNDDTLNALANASLEKETAAAIISKEFIKQKSNINSNDDTLNAFANASLEQDTAATILSKEFTKQESNISSNNDTLNALANASLEEDTAAAIILSKEFIKQESYMYSNDDTINALANASLEKETAAGIISKEFNQQDLKTSIPDKIKEFIHQESKIYSKITESTKSNQVESVIQSHNTEIASSPELVAEPSNKAKKTLTKQSSDETDVNFMTLCFPQRCLAVTRLWPVVSEDILYYQNSRMSWCTFCSGIILSRT
ncbi:hypothetical protein evm_005305 [Chilo suppressalis]|nr:hypothetical protein evm_005305 [Chilo suppressalis]